MYLFLWQRNIRDLPRAGVAVLGASAVGAAAQMFGASRANSAQQQAAARAQATQMAMFNTIRNDLEPYRELGAKYSKRLDKRMPFLTSAIDVTDELKNPDSTAAKAYDFTLTQGLKAAQNSAAARGLGVSGAALKGATTFATGLANNTWRNLFDMENINRQNEFTRLKSLVDTGQSASAQTGTAGTNAANQISASQTGAGNAEAAMWNTMGGAVRTAANDIGGYAAYRGIYGDNNNRNNPNGPGASSV